MDDLFAPLSGEWRRVSAKLATIRRLFIVTLAAAVLGAGLVLALIPGIADWARIVGYVLAIGAVASAAWGWTWAGRNQRSWGYAENDDDLLVTRGVMFKRLVAIPYGRMQYVDVQAGPIARAYGIATVTLHTASTDTAAEIPGLLAEEAIRLRNRLTELGESRGAGL